MSLVKQRSVHFPFFKGLIKIVRIYSETIRSGNFMVKCQQNCFLSALWLDRALSSERCSSLGAVRQDSCIGYCKTTIPGHSRAIWAQFLQNLGTPSCGCLRLKLTFLRRHMKYEGSFVVMPNSIFSENSEECSSWKRVCLPMTNFWNPWPDFSLHLQGSEVTVEQSRWNGKSASTQLSVLREILNVQGNLRSSQPALRLWSLEISVHRAEWRCSKGYWRQLPKL